MLIGEIRNTSPYAAYTWGPDGIVSKRDLVGNTSVWYEFGPQGETRKLTNGSGAVTDTYYYNAYGETISSSGTTVNPFRYGGKYGYFTETYTGLLLATQRWYSPQLMRWVSRDPIGHKGGVNLYSYVDENPVKWIDPDGLAKCVYNIRKHILVCKSNDDKTKRNVGPRGVKSGDGKCVNNNSCNDDVNDGPIPPGRYSINKDNRSGKSGFWRLEPNPKIPGWKCKLGLKRCGFQIHAGSISWGCITINKEDPSAMEDYNKINEMLNDEDGSNTLDVTP